MTKTGPNDMSHIILALGKHFSFFFFILFDTNEYFIAFILLQITNRERSEASNSHHHRPCQNQDKQGREGGKGRRQQGMGSRYVFCLYICIYTSYFTHKVYQQVLWTMMTRATTTGTTSTPAHPSYTIPFGNMTNGGGAQDVSCLKPRYVFFFF